MVKVTAEYTDKHWRVNWNTL